MTILKRSSAQLLTQQLFGQNKLITRFDGRSCIDDWFDYVHRLGLT